MRASTVLGYQGGARDHEGRRRIGVWLPDECIDWLDRTAARDQSSRSDLLEGIVLLAIDDELKRRLVVDREPTPDATKARLADETWGPGNWVICESCHRDDLGQPVRHHKDAHAEART